MHIAEDGTVTLERRSKENLKVYLDGKKVVFHELKDYLNKVKGYNKKDMVMALDAWLTASLLFLEQMENSNE